MLKEYANKEYTPEVMYFWHHIVKYREMIEQQHDPDAIKAHEFLMVELYIDEESEHTLNLSYELRNLVRSNPHDVDAWLEVQDEVARLIRRGPYLHLALEVSSRVRTSWEKLLELVSPEEAGRAFFTSLFTNAPSVEGLFGPHFLTSSKTVMLPRMIDSCVRLLVDPEKLIDTIVDLGRRHSRYGARPEHFKIVGETLISTLGSVLKDDFDELTQRAWVTVFEMMSTLMTMAIDPSQINQFIVEPPESMVEEGKRRSTARQ
jgi:hemoglobin-like flavoprotein